MDGKVVTLIAQYKGVDGVTLPAKRPLEVRRQNDSGWSLVVFEGHSHWVPTTWLRPSSSGTNRANTTPAKSSAADKVEPVSKAEPESNDTPESEPPQPEEQQPKQRAKEPNTAEDNSKVSPDDATHTTLQGTQSFDDQDDTDDSDDGDDEAFLPSTASPSQTQKPADPAARDDAEPKVSQTWHPLLLRQQLAHITRRHTHSLTLSPLSPLQYAFHATLHTTTKVLFQAQAIFDFMAEAPDELSFVQGQLIDILSGKEESDWWTGSLKGASEHPPPTFACSCLLPRDSPHPVPSRKHLRLL